MVNTRFRRKATIALYCPDTNLPIGIGLPANAATRGGKAAIVHWAKALANRGFEITVFAGKPERQNQTHLSIRGLDECEGVFDVVIFHTGQMLHFDQPQASRLDSRLRVLWLSGPARVAPPNGPLDVVVAPSEYVRDLAQNQWGLPAVPFQVIRGEAVTRKLPQRLIRTADRDPFLGVYLSPPEKGFDHIFTVLDRLHKKGLRFSLAVFGNQAFWGDVSRFSKIPWLKFMGDVPQEKMQETLLRCGFMPYFVAWADGFSLATAEAMSAGVVAFASAHGSNADFVDHGRTGFLVPITGGKPDLGEAEALLEQYLLRPEGFLPIRLAASQAVPTWQERAVEWETLLLTLLARKKASHSQKTTDQATILAERHTDANNPTLQAEKPSRKFSVLLVGDFGVGNTGDDAILLSTYQLLRARESVLRMTVVAPKLDSLAFLQMPMVSLRDWPNVEQAVANSDLVVFAGGGLFHDWWALERDKLLTAKAEGPTAYLSLVALTKRAGKPCLVLGVGVGPLRSKQSVETVAEVLSAADVVTVRDQGSFQLLNVAGVTKKTLVAVTADPVFDLPHQVPSSQHLWQLLGTEPPPRPRICLVLRGWDVIHPQSSFLSRIAAAISKVLSKFNGTCLFLPFQLCQGHPWTDDVAVGVQMGRFFHGPPNFVILPHLPPQAVDAVIAESDVIVTMRYHGAVFAFRNLIPVLGLAYDPKVENLFSDALLSRWCWPLSGWTSSALADAINELLSQPLLQRDRQLAYRNLAKQRLALHTVFLDRFLLDRQGVLRSADVPHPSCWPLASLTEPQGEPTI